MRVRLRSLVDCRARRQHSAPARPCCLARVAPGPNGGVLSEWSWAAEFLWAIRCVLSIGFRRDGGGGKGRANL